MAYDQYISQFNTQAQSNAGDQLPVQTDSPTPTMVKYVAGPNGVFPISVQSASVANSIAPQNDYQILGTPIGTGTLEAGQCVCQMVGDNAQNAPLVTLNVSVGQYSPVIGVLTQVSPINVETPVTTSGNCTVPLLSTSGASPQQYNTGTISQDQNIYRDYTSGKLTTDEGNVFPAQIVGVATKTIAGDGVNPTQAEIRFSVVEYGVNAQTQQQINNIGESVESIRTHGFMSFTASLENPAELIADPVPSSQVLKLVGLFVKVITPFAGNAFLNVGLLDTDTGLVDDSIAVINCTLTGKFDQTSTEIQLNQNFGIALPAGKGIYIQAAGYISGGIDIIPQFTLIEP